MWLKAFVKCVHQALQNGVSMGGTAVSVVCHVGEGQVPCRVNEGNLAEDVVSNADDRVTLEGRRRICLSRPCSLPIH